MPEITIPNDWTPMAHQMPVWQYMQGGGKRAALCWHRRAGKDSFAINYLATAAMQRVGVYWHMLPTATQGRKVIWAGIDRHGRRVIDQAIPPALRVKKRDDEMWVELVNGSVIQVVGSDNFDSLVGANPIGVVFSEYAIANPLAWSYIRPMLAENGGWAVFISTPRGHNHFWRMFTTNQSREDWFCELRTIDDTVREDGSPIISREVLDAERAEGMDESLLQQEYMCSWEGGLQGAYFTEEVRDIRENRLGYYANDPRRFAMTAWDIGIDDRTAIGVFMAHPETGHPILMDALEDRNKGLPHYVRQVKNWQGDYLFHWHFGPHDMHKTEFTTNKRIVDVAADLGVSFEVLPRYPLEDGIDSLRAFLRVLHVNENPNTLHVLDMISSYRRELDAKNGIYRNKPVHDFSSDTTDMMRYAALAWEPGILDRRAYGSLSPVAKRAMR